MSELEKKQITEQFVALTATAFKGDVEAQQCVMVYQMWFKTASKITAVLHLLGGSFE